MGEWKWTTFILFAGVAVVSTQLIKRAESHVYYSIYKGQKKYTSLGRIYLTLTYVLLITLCIIRNVDLYPPYIGDAQTDSTTDMQAYIYFFREGMTAGWDWKKILTFNQWEPLFYSLNLLIRAFTANHRVYWFILYTIYCVCLLYFLTHVFDRNMCYAVVPFFIVQLLYGMCALRSCIANAICLVAYVQLQRKKTVSFLVLVIAATLFHYTAIFVLPLVIVVSIGNKIKNNRREKCIALIVLFISLFVLMRPIAEYLIAQTKYSVYLGHRMTIIGQAPLICCTICSLFFYNDIKKKFSSQLTFVYMVFYNFLVMPFIVEFNISRISDFFMLPRIVVWTLVVDCATDKIVEHRYKSIVKMGAFFIMFFWMIKTIYDMKNYGIMPYLAFWI